MANIKKELLKGVFWNAVGKYSAFAVSLVVSMILARQIAPKAYGVVAIATVIIHFLAILSTMGIGPAIIQRRDLSSKDINDIFSFSCFVGLAFSAVFFLLSWPIASFYQIPSLKIVCQLLTVNVFFSTINMVPSALMAKNKRFKEIAKRTVVIQIVVGSAAVISALHGAGIYALLISPIISSVAVFFVNTFYYPVKFNLRFSLEPVKRIFSYSFFQFAFQFVNFFAKNLDKLIIGKFMSPTALGFYEKSYRLMQVPATQLTGVIYPVLQPVLSTLQDDMGEMSKKHNKIVKFIGSISIPLAVFLFYAGPEVIRVFYGGQWDGAIRPFQILALSLASQLILATSGSIWQSCNATNYLFCVGLATTFVTISAFVIAAYYIGSVEAIAAAWTISTFVNFFITYITMYKKILKSSIWPMLRGLLAPLANGIILAVALALLNDKCQEINMVLSLVIKSVVAAVVTAPFFILSKQYKLK